MASWREVEEAAPELAAAVRERMEAQVHKVLGTLRRDGSPRLSGSEAKFFDGELYFGSMGGALKARDLQRDPRFALQSGTVDPPEWAGDARISGRVEEIADRETIRDIFRRWGSEADPGDSHLFRADVEEIATVRLNDARDKLVIESWSVAGGVRRRER